MRILRRLILDRASEEKKRRIYVFVGKIPILRLILKRYIQMNNPVWVVSFMKCGRTWLRVMLGKALQLNSGIQEPDILRLADSKEKCPDLPLISFIHEDAAHWKKPEELTTSEDHYRFKKVIFLVRDPRDVVVSLYFEKNKRLRSYINGEKLEHSAFAGRIKPYEGDLHTFLYERVGSFDTILKYYNIWENNRHIPEQFLLVRYEDMHQNPQKELRRVLNFLGMRSVSDEVIATAVKFASFNSMHSMEEDDEFDANRLRPGNKKDSESYKTRKGKIGGFVDYLNDKDIRWLNRKIRDTLSDYYAY